MRSRAPLRGILTLAGVHVGLSLACGGMARAASPQAPAAGPPADSALHLGLAVSWTEDEVPTFRGAARDRLGLRLSGAVWPHRRLGVDLRLDGGAEWTPSGGQELGPEGLAVATRLALLAPADEGHRLELGWGARVPWSADAGAAGSDETDSELLLSGGVRRGPIGVYGVLGLQILGNPLRFANQDDVPLAWAMADARRGGLVLSARVGGGLPTPRNPARLEAALGLEQVLSGRGDDPGPWRLGAELASGLGPAGPDLRAQAWLAAAWPCLPGGGD